MATEKCPKLGLIEGGPTLLVKILNEIQERTDLTAHAIVRGKALAGRIAPELHAQRLVEVEYIDTLQYEKHDAIVEIVHTKTTKMVVALAQAKKDRDERAAARAAQEAGIE